VRLRLTKWTKHLWKQGTLNNIFKFSFTRSYMV
jgi:hypothetical protein